MKLSGHNFTCSRHTENISFVRIELSIPDNLLHKLLLFFLLAPFAWNFQVDMLGFLRTRAQSVLHR